MSVRIVLPPVLVERARAVAQGREPAVALQPAATVVLLRQHPSAGLQAYLQRRHRGLAFAGGMFAFPGGRIDEQDLDMPERLWSGPPATAWQEWFAAGSADEARAHVVGLVRELFEETGVLLAVPEPGRPAQQPTEQERARVAHGGSLAQLLAARGLRLDAQALRPWSRWVTPRFERRRFDAWFFVAELPPGQQPRVATGESHEGRWERPAAAMAALRTGDLAMLPPTWWTMRQLAEFSDAHAVLEHPPPMTRYTVGWAVEGDEAVMVLPDDPRYPGDDPKEGE